MARNRSARVVSKRYRLERLLGAGASEVWLARDERLGGLVAVKLLPPAANLRQAKTAMGLSHPNVVGVLDAGEADGVPFVVTEYVHGRTLRAVLEEDGRFEPAEAARMGARLAAGLAYVHARGIIHCDLKPENIVLSRDGTPKLVDFGAATRLEATIPADEVESVAGTVAYMAPEVLGGAAPDARSDVYSLGLVVFELVAGRLPFTGPPQAMAAQKLAGAPPLLRSVAPGAAPALEEALAKALAPGPALRWQSAADFGRALAAAADGRALPALAAPPVPPQRRPGAPPPPPSSRRSRRPAALVLAGLLAAALLTVAGLAVLAGGDGPAPAAVTGSPGPPTSPPAEPTPLPQPEANARPSVAPPAPVQGRAQDNPSGGDEPDKQDKKQEKAKQKQQKQKKRG
jgi:serine/threonine protein kinase